MKQQLLHADSVLYALVCGPMWLWPLPLPSGDHFRSVFGDKAGWAQAVSWWLSAWGIWSRHVLLQEEVVGW